MNKRRKLRKRKGKHLGRNYPSKVCELDVKFYGTHEFEAHILKSLPIAIEVRKNKLIQLFLALIVTPTQSSVGIYSLLSNY